MTLSKNALSIDWVVHGVSGDEASGWSSSLASNRYRAILPAKSLIELGHRVRFIDAASWQGPDRQSPADVVVIGKLLPGSSTALHAAVGNAILRYVKASQEAGIPVLADFNDDHFDSSVTGFYWRSLANSVDVCVAGSSRMAERMQSVTSRPTQVVGDPVASPLGPPKVFRAPGVVARWARGLLQPQGSSSRLKLVWYGSETNWKAIQAWAEAIAPLARDQRFILWVVTRELDAIDAYVRGFNQRFGPQALMELVPWDEASQWAVVADADAVLIPSVPSDAKKAVKTGNRLTDALHAGRHVIASPLPSYQPYDPYVTLTDDPLQALKQYLARPDEVLARVVKGQEHVRVKSSREQTALAWLEVLDLARQAHRAQREATARQALVLQSTDVQADVPGEAARILLFAMDTLNASMELRFFQPLGELQRAGKVSWELITEHGLRNSLADLWEEADGEYLVKKTFAEFQPTIVVFSRYAGPFVDLALALARQAGIPTMLHLDDDLLDIPLEFGKGKAALHRDPRRLNALRTLLVEADLVHTANQEMVERLRARGYDRAYMALDIPAGGEVLRMAAPGETLRIGYMGGKDHALDLAMVVPPLVELLQEFPQVSFELVGEFKMPAELQVFGDRVRLFPYVRGCDNLLKFLVEREWDVGLCPLAPLPFNLVKTHLKWIDYTRIGAVSIASRGTVFDQCCRDGRGLLVDGHAEWRDALRSLVLKPESRLEILRKAQALVREQYTMQSLTRQVLAAMRHAAHLHSARQQRTDLSNGSSSKAVRPVEAALAPVSASLVRLNLGCGDKILPGYVNVDVVAARAGKSPDVMCDLRELTPFASDYADEILSVHVVEHFWRWEVEAVLKEWVRVLKPGGKLILECPNLQAACEAFLADPERGSLPGKEGQTTMWVFYGDPRWKDPLMVHRWGYTPASLGRLLASVGLVDVGQEPAQYKMREPRDMRVVGFKPHPPRGATVPEEARLVNDVSAAEAAPADDAARELAALQEAELSIKQRDVAAADLLLSPFAAQSTNLGILVRLARIRMVQGAHEAAFELLKRAEQHHPLEARVWDAFAELFKLQRRYSEEMVYRRKLAYAGTGAAVEAHTALVLSMVNAAARGEEVSLREVQLASKKVGQTATDDPAPRLAFAETLYRIRGLESEAREHYSAASPCPSDRRDVRARWVGLRQWMEASGSPLHELSTAGRPGQRPMVAELEDVCISPSFQWIPLLDEEQVGIDGFQVSRMRLRSEKEDAPILMNSATHFELRLPKELRSIEIPAVLIGGGGQYYHHSIEHVSRLATLDALGLGADLPLVVNDDLLPFQLEHLALLGYPPERLIRVKVDEPVRFRRLLAPTPLVQGGKWMDPMIPAWYRSRLVPARTGRAQRRLYLSRGPALRRQILNEEELRRMLVSEGYEVVRPETLTVAEQIALFSEASHIVSPSGAALTNMIYAPPGAAIVSMYSRYLHTGAGELYFDALAEACGHRFSVVMGDVTSLRGVERVGDADIMMDVEAVRAALH